MQSLITQIEELRGQGDTKDYWRALDDVIDLIKQHERPVDEVELQRDIQRAVYERLLKKDGSDFITLAILEIVRPYLKQQQPVSAEGLQDKIIEQINKHADRADRFTEVTHVIETRWVYEACGITAKE